METSLAQCRETGWRWGEAQALASIGAAFADEGRAREASEALSRAIALAREDAIPGLRYVASARRALVSPAAVAEALAAASECERECEVGEAMQARFLLWRATSDRAHLVEAKRRLDHLVENAPPDSRDSMLQGVRLHREIAEAASAS
jgi:hypothetical protein